MRTWLPAVLLGAISGYVALRLGPIGLMLAVVVAAGLTALYWLQGRYPDVGWLLGGLGLVPALFFGRGILDDMSDPAVTVSAETIPWFGMCLVLAVSGAALVTVTRRRE